jgi:DNA-binding beta-propeller fold protein YncE
MRRRIATLALLGLVLAVAAAAASGHDADRGHEVWAVDQSNTTGTTSGGTLYVYDGESLRGRGAGEARPERIDLGGAAKELCMAQTGTAPVRPHMLLFNAARTHAVLSFVASGHVLFLDAEKRAPLACIDVGAQAHAAVPSPDESYVVVANQNGKLVQRIATDYATNTFRLEPEATLDLANGTTPSGAQRQDPQLRPDNAPICPLIDSTSRLAFVTLRGGGLFVLDPRSSPMRIVAEYDRQTIHPNGCGGLEAAGKMYVNSGGGTANNLSEFDVYAFDLGHFRSASGGLLCAPTAPNTPAPKLVVSQDDREHTDSHGTTLTRHGRYLWVADRAGNRIVVIKTKTDEVVGEFSLTGDLSDDPSPDLLDISPRGDRVYVSLRGSLPLSGDPHASTGSTPGVGVIHVESGGRTGRLRAIARIANPDGPVDRADPHGLRVRER